MQFQFCLLFTFFADSSFLYIFAFYWVTFGSDGFTKNDCPLCHILHGRIMLATELRCHEILAHRLLADGLYAYRCWLQRRCRLSGAKQLVTLTKALNFLACLRAKLLQFIVIFIRTVSSKFEQSLLICLIAFFIFATLEFSLWLQVVFLQLF